MALKVAVASGNWSNPATWNGGILPRTDDIVASNTYTVTIDQNITVVQLTNKSASITRSNPTMTSPTAPSGIVTSQPADNGLVENPAWRAFDNTGNLVPSWYAGGSYPKWIAYEYATPTTITKYSLGLRGDSYSPRDWTFEAWNGTSWIVLHTVAAYTTGESYTSPNFNNSTPYIKYRVNVSADRGAGLLIILEINLFEFGYTQDAFQGGGFIIGPNVSIVTTTSGLGFDPYSVANGLTYSQNSPSVSSFTGNLRGPGGYDVLTISGTGTLNVIGNVTTPVSLTASATIRLTNNATLNVTGTVAYYGGELGIAVNSTVTSAVVSITGDVTIGQIIWGGQRSISFDGAGTLNVVGTISHGLSGGSEQTCITLTPPQNRTIIFNHTGIITNTSVSFQGLFMIIVYGTGSVTMNLNGELVGGNSYLIAPSSTTTIFLKKIRSGTYGQNPLAGIKRAFLVPEITDIVEYRNNSTGGNISGTPAPTFTYYAPAAIGDLPAASNVRFGTTYGYGTLTGIVRIPHPNSVAYGVAVDATFGNAVLSVASIWDYLISNITVENSIGMRLKNVSTPQITGEQLEAFLRLD
jgi:hypothetical protein